MKTIILIFFLFVSLFHSDKDIYNQYYYYYSKKYQYDNEIYFIPTVFSVEGEKITFFDYAELKPVLYKKNNTVKFSNGSVLAKNDTGCTIVYIIRHNKIYLVRNNSNGSNTIIIHYEKYFIKEIE